MEAIVVIVGFLGVGKTTLLRKLVENYLSSGWNPYIILNDYENANMDAQGFLDYLPEDKVRALSGSCICCSGVNELRSQVNRIPPREKGITLIEANGTTDATSLMGFLGVGMEKHFLPPVQIAVVDVRNWQNRDYYNDLEANQVQVSSLIILNFVECIDIEKLVQVEQDLRSINPKASITHWDKFDFKSLPELHPSENEIVKIEHSKSHWSSCSVDLPDPIPSTHIKEIVSKIPKTILRVKGCTRLDNDAHYSYFERTPNGDIFIRPYTGHLVTGPKLLTIGPGSDPVMLKKIIEKRG